LVVYSKIGYKVPDFSLEKCQAKPKSSFLSAQIYVCFIEEAGDLVLRTIFFTKRGYQNKGSVAFG